MLWSIVFRSVWAGEREREEEEEERERRKLESGRKERETE